MVEFVKPTEPRFKVLDTPDGVEVVIPPKLSYQLIFLGMMMAPAALLVTKLLEEGVTLGDLTWTIFSYSIICILFWPVVRIERVRITPTQLIIKRERFGFRRSESYELFVIENLRVASQPSNKRDLCMISFDYGEFTIRLGTEIEDAEAKLIVERLGSAIRQTKHDHGHDG